MKYPIEGIGGHPPLNRIRINLGGGRILSLIQGHGAYGGEDTVEAAILGPANEKGERGVGAPIGWLNAKGLMNLIRREHGFKSEEVDLSVHNPDDTTRKDL